MTTKIDWTSALKLYWASALAFIVGILLIGSIAAFLLYVPAFHVLTVSVIVLALVVTFCLGVQTGGRRIRFRRLKRSQEPAGMHQLIPPSIGRVG